MTIVLQQLFTFIELREILDHVELFAYYEKAHCYKQLEKNYITTLKIVLKACIGLPKFIL